MDYEFPIYVDRIKPERKWRWLQIYTGFISHMAHPNVIRLYQCIDELVSCLVLFYIHFHYRICFNDFRYEIRF